MGITLAHLKEAVDRLLDRIALVAKTASKSIEEMGKTKADKVNIMSLTIPASGWSSDSTAGCPYYLDIPVSGLTANDCVVYNGAVRRRRIQHVSHPDDCNAAGR